MEIHPHTGQPGHHHQECPEGSHCLESHEDQNYEDSQQTDYYGSTPEDTTTAAKMMKKHITKMMKKSTTRMMKKGTTRKESSSQTPQAP